VNGWLGEVGAVLVVWLVSGLALGWAWLPGRWRRFLSVLASAVGLIFLVVAVSSEGLHEARTVSVFLLGAPYLTEIATASASLPYYVLTGVLLLVGTATLAVGDEVAPVLVRRPTATAIALSIGVTVLRLLLEKVAAPSPLTRLFGLVWMAPVVGAFLLAALRAEGRGFGAFLGRVLIYAFAVRSFVASLYLGATWLHLGSHFDLSTVSKVVAPWGRVYWLTPGSLDQLSRLVLLPQLVVWPAYTLLAALIGAAILQIVVSAWPGRSSPVFPPPVPVAPAPQRQL
jgi:hypothetical protein